MFNLIFYKVFEKIANLLKKSGIFLSLILKVYVNGDIMETGKINVKTTAHQINEISVYAQSGDIKVEQEQVAAPFYLRISFAKSFKTRVSFLIGSVLTVVAQRKNFNRRLYYGRFKINCPANL